MSAKNRKVYFSAGPAMIVQEVMKQVHEELLDYGNSGLSVLEMSHRSKLFDTILTEAEADLRKLLNIPENYSVLFMHGGARTQFDAIPMNISPENSKTEYIITGSWSKYAANEAEKHVQVERQLVDGGTFKRVPATNELKANSDVTYRYYCDNETIQGVEFNYVPSNGQVPLVCDMTSNFLSRPIDVSKYGIIYAGAQKNCGMAGLAIVIVRKDLQGKQRSYTPNIQNYKVIADNRSLYNTPPTFAIYIAGLCFKWMLKQGGLEVMDKMSREKSDYLYNAIDSSGGFYSCPVSKESRSRMNVVFLLSDKSLEDKFVTEGADEGLYGFKGHRSVGGFRVSLYHAITFDDVRRLVNFMDSFRTRNS